MTPGASTLARGGSAGTAVLVTLAAVIVYRLGCQVPLPGLDADAVTQFAARTGMGGERISMFAIGVTPIFTALILLELARHLFPGLRRREAADPAHAQRMRQLTRGLALAFAVVQGYGMATALEGIGGLVTEPGAQFRVGVATTIVAATALLSWLADEITRRGLGSGFWVLLAAPVLAQLPATVATAIELARSGDVSAPSLLIGPAWLMLAAAWLVALDRARTETLPAVRLAGVWPPILATTVLGWLAGTAMGFAGPEANPRELWYAPGQPGYIAGLGVLIVLFAMLRLSGMRAALPSRAAAGHGLSLAPLGMAAGLIQAAVCVSGEIVALVSPLTMRGMWLIVVVALALRILERYAALSNDARA